MVEGHNPYVEDIDMSLILWKRQVNIRFVEKSDLPSLEWDGEFSHLRQVYAETYRRTRAELAIMYIAEMPQQGVIGQVFAQLQSELPHQAYIHAFRVRTEFRKAGIGSRLMTVIEGDLKHRGYHHVALNVALDNPDAKRLYLRRGYRVMDRVSGKWSYYDQFNRLQHVSEPSWRLVKKL